MQRQRPERPGQAKKKPRTRARPLLAEFNTVECRPWKIETWGMRKIDDILFRETRLADARQVWSPGFGLAQSAKNPKRRTAAAAPRRKLRWSDAGRLGSAIARSLLGRLSKLSRRKNSPSRTRTKTGPARPRKERYGRCRMNCHPDGIRTIVSACKRQSVKAAHAPGYSLRVDRTNAIDLPSHSRIVCAAIERQMIPQKRRIAVRRGYQRGIIRG